MRFRSNTNTVFVHVQKFSLVGIGLQIFTTNLDFNAARPSLMRNRKIYSNIYTMNTMIVYTMIWPY